MKVTWKTRDGDEIAGELHSFVQTQGGIMGMVVTTLADGVLGFFPVNSWDLRVVDKKAKKS